ncbi:uncharacterized protein LOC102207572 [Pundamilia nyererei]|uniref:Uncharacterized protein LOC102207572 n=1 Tax=Pundamilia nyererei TaxID=303518 RepID=A0A9Y3VZD1_9CICH|nr:PREDICTED: uncharacterized protein LOC102207572 [Pundamilia nyererei]
MPKISSRKWKEALTAIIDELEKSQFNKMLELLRKIPRSQKTPKFKDKMPQKIIEHYGEEKSISAINRVMSKIPRKDAVIQDQLRPFVLTLKKKKLKEKKAFKGTHACDPVMGGSTAAFVANGTVSKSKSKHLEPEPAADSKKSFQQDKKRTISDVKSSKQILDTEVIVGKVLQKSGLCTFKIDKKEKPYFNLAVADETDVIKVVVYKNDLYSEIEEERSYLFIKLQKNEDVLKVTSSSKVSETSAVKVPAEIEKTARTLLCPESPLCSIAEVKTFAESSKASIRGTITEMKTLERITVMKQRKTKKQDFHLKDDTDSIKVSVWGENTQQCKGLLVGDIVKVTNVKTNYFRGVTSVNSTPFTRIRKVCSASFQTGRIEIKAISKANKTWTHVVAEFNQQLQTFVVASQLLAKAFGVKLDENFKQKLVDKLPLSTVAETQGNKIHKIK